MLDSTPLGKLAHPTPRAEIKNWLDQLLAADYRVIVPETADYEVRRSFLLAHLPRSIARLDMLGQALIYLPLTTQVMRKAAELWADARRIGRPTAGRKEIDADVILAAQALEAGATVATENLGHITRYVAAKNWRDIRP